MSEAQAVPVPARAAARSRRNGLNEAAAHSMRRLYLTRLAIALHAIDREALQTPVQRNVHALVHARLEGEATNERAQNLDWNDIYELERLMALLLSGASLRQEIAGRIRDLGAEDPPTAARFQGEFEALCKPAGQTAKTLPDDETLRGFLLRVLEGLQWRANERHLAQPIRKRAVKSLLVCLVLAFVLLVVPYVLLNVDFVDVSQLAPKTTTTVATAQDTSGRATDAPVIGVSQAQPGSEADKNPPLSKWWSLFPLWTALTAGLLGAFFSRLLSVQRARMSLDEAFLHRELSYSLLRAGVGVCGALIVYIFLRSGIVHGALFPDFTQVTIEWIATPPGTLPIVVVVPSKALALLTFWCFLAGFSEALVPRILGNAESQLGNAASAAPPQR